MGDKPLCCAMVATKPDEMDMASGSNHPDDLGLNGSLRAAFTAVLRLRLKSREFLTDKVFVRVSQNGHALELCDGTPFFMLAVTTGWLAPPALAVSQLRPPQKLTNPAWALRFEDCRWLFVSSRAFLTPSVCCAAFPNWDCYL